MQALHDHFQAQSLGAIRCLIAEISANIHFYEGEKFLCEIFSDIHVVREKYIYILKEISLLHIKYYIQQNLENIIGSSKK